MGIQRWIGIGSGIFLLLLIGLAYLETRVQAQQASLAEAIKAVVRIRGCNVAGCNVGLGSGVIIHSSGVILTANHVTLTDPRNPLSPRLEDFVIEVTDNARQSPQARYRARLLAAKPEADLALLGIYWDESVNQLLDDPAAVNLPALSIADVNAMGLGDRLHILGYPLAGGAAINYTETALGGFDENGALLKVNASLNEGYSGGPVLVEQEGRYAIAGVVILRRADVSFIRSIDQLSGLIWEPAARRVWADNIQVTVQESDADAMLQVSANIHTLDYINGEGHLLAYVFDADTRQPWLAGDSSLNRSANGQLVLRQEFSAKHFVETGQKVGINLQLSELGNDSERLLFRLLVWDADKTQVLWAGSEWYRAQPATEAVAVAPTQSPTFTQPPLSTPTPSATDTPLPTNTATATRTPTEAASNTPPPTSTATATRTPTHTSTPPSVRPTQSRPYTLDADFDEGILLNLNHDAPNSDQLQLNQVITLFPFIWIALSARGTIAKVDTTTGEVLGEYRSAPEGMARNPSRTTVDLNGNVWAGNRDETGGNKGSVVHIGLAESFQCVDRNGNREIDTSTGLGDIRPWPNTNGADSNGGVSTAEDECIIHYVRAGSQNTRSVSVGANNNVWVGGNNDSNPGNRIFDLVDGNSGEILQSLGPLDCGGYGGLVDGNGVLWSASPDLGQLLRYDPAMDNATCISVAQSYGLGVDSNGNVWNSQWTNNTITQLSPDGTVLGTFSSGGNNSRGVTITPDNHIWIANSASDTVTRLDNEGNVIATIPVGDEPTGVAVDANGKVWVTNRYSNNAMRIDPATNAVDLTVDLGAGAEPYNYSDMTGIVALGSTAPQGTWTVIYDSETAGTSWGKIEWSSDEPSGSSVTARARVAETEAGLGGVTYTDVSNGEEIDLDVGRFLQVELKLTPGEDNQSPVVRDVTVETKAGTSE